jgi:bifunctional DNA-binding transcriptional regulator/antitoxin component of YhaV-PrlF toxin-antitoxin module
MGTKCYGIKMSEIYSGDQPPIPGQLVIDGLEDQIIPDEFRLDVKEPGQIPELVQYRVSAVGQITVPASARRRWNLMNGGRVNVADAGVAVIMFPENLTLGLSQELINIMTLPELSEPKTSHKLKLSGLLVRLIEQSRP